jgi:hypothetical protein
MRRDPAVRREAADIRILNAVFLKILIGCYRENAWLVFAHTQVRLGL